MLTCNNKKSAFKFLCRFYFHEGTKAAKHWVIFRYSAPGAMCQRLYWPKNAQWNQDSYHVDGMLYALADSFGSVSQCSIFEETTQANVKHKAHSVFFFWTNRAQFATCTLTARWWPESSPLVPAPATVNPEYFVRTKFSYAGDLRPFVRMKFSYSCWPLRILWLALSFSYAFYFRTEAAMYEIYRPYFPRPRKYRRLFSEPIYWPRRSRSQYGEENNQGIFEAKGNNSLIPGRLAPSPPSLCSKSAKRKLCDCA